MANKFYQSQINFTKLEKYVAENKEKLYKTKDGDIMVPANLWMNEQEDQFGNIGSLQINTPKDTKKIYIMNLKDKKENKIPF